MTDHYRVVQRSGDYCDADGEDWPCSTVRAASQRVTAQAARTEVDLSEGLGIPVDPRIRTLAEKARFRSTS